ncbi:MAG: hypothetical protein K6G24_11045 [Lachnospiraceae bacterium]|nr:hypothetical protein [Lachnospiraceae bacterium]
MYPVSNAFLTAVKANVLAALNIIDHNTARVYEGIANNVRDKSEKINLSTLLEKDGVKRSAEKKARPQKSKKEQFTRKPLFDELIKA